MCNSPTVVKLIRSQSATFSVWPQPLKYATLVANLASILMECLYDDQMLTELYRS